MNDLLLVEDGDTISKRLADAKLNFVEETFASVTRNAVLACSQLIVNCQRSNPTGPSIWELIRWAKTSGRTRTINLVNINSNATQIEKFKTFGVDEVWSVEATTIRPIQELLTKSSPKLEEDFEFIREAGVDFIGVFANILLDEARADGLSPKDAARIIAGQLDPKDQKKFHERLRAANLF